MEVNILKISILPKNQEFSWNVLSVRFKTTLLAHWASKCTAMHINFVPKFLNNIKNFEFFNEDYLTFYKKFTKIVIQNYIVKKEKLIT